MRISRLSAPKGLQRSDFFHAGDTPARENWIFRVRALKPFARENKKSKQQKKIKSKPYPGTLIQPPLA